MFDMVQNVRGEIVISTPPQAGLSSATAAAWRMFSVPKHAIDRSCSVH